MIELADTLSQRRRPVLAVLYGVSTLLFICLLAPVVQTYRSSIMVSIQSSYNSSESASMDSGPNAVTDTLSQGVDNIGSFLHTVEVRMLTGIMAVATAVTHFDKVMVHGPGAVATALLHGFGKGAVATGHAIGGTFIFAGHAVGRAFILTGHGIGHAFSFISHGISSIFGSFSRVTHLNSLVQPQDSTTTPVITQLRARQAAIIESGTKAVMVAPAASGSGGACDSGDGNGGYPMVWCNAPMDSTATIYGSGDPINRECTSYAYWYFTTVEGHTDLHTSGDAKYWAASTNYPAHATPQVGAIAVETEGTYGHVAIVQALPDQMYDGQVVPAGDVLVSEMNYDWHGHFRYSYSPLNKFSAYIYP